MRRLGILLLVLFLISVSVVAEEETYTVQNCANWISLRSQPTVNAVRIDRIPKGSTVTFVSLPEESDDFFKVRYDGQEGYVLRCCLAGAMPVDRPGVRYIDQGGMFGTLLRSGPSSESRVVMDLPLGAEVISYGVVAGADGSETGSAGGENLYEYVEYEGVYGFVPVGFLNCIPVSERGGLKSATLDYYPDGKNKTASQKITDAGLLDELEIMFAKSRLSLSGQCPYTTLLTLELEEDGSKVYFKVAADDCKSLISPSGAVYEYSEAYEGRFWMIFDKIFDELA